MNREPPSKGRLTSSLKGCSGVHDCMTSSTSTSSRWSHIPFLRSAIYTTACTASFLGLYCPGALLSSGSICPPGEKSTCGRLRTNKIHVTKKNETQSKLDCKTYLISPIMRLPFLSLRHLHPQLLRGRRRTPLNTRHILNIHLKQAIQILAD